MTRQLKSILILVFILIMGTPSCFAQKKDTKEDQLAIKTMHVFNLKPKYTADDLQIGLEKFNSLFVKLGHPDCHYRLWESSGEKKHESYLWESSWSSKSVYDEIHKNEEYRKLVRKDMLGLRKMFQDHTYYRFQEHLFNAAL
jgi:hypothetical protein